MKLHEAINKRLNETTITIVRPMTQADLAHRMGVEASWISTLLSGKRNPTFATMQKIAKALNVPIRKLMEEVDE